jgi:hypothetical protein
MDDDGFLYIVDRKKESNQLKKRWARKISGTTN